MRFPYSFDERENASLAWERHLIGGRIVPAAALELASTFTLSAILVKLMQ